MQIIDKLVQGNLIVHTNAEPTQILAMGINACEVMFHPTLELYTTYGIQCHMRHMLHLAYFEAYLKLH